MTYEEVKRIRLNPTAEDVDNAELHKMIDVAIEKQIPKKPIYEIEELFRLCPNCAFPLPLHFKFCNECGQALDWGDCE